VPGRDIAMKHSFGRVARELHNYLGKTGKDALPVLRQEYKRTRLIDVQRRILIYLHALWGCDFVIKSITGEDDDHGRPKPFVSKGCIHLPDFYYGFTTEAVAHVTGLETYRAAAAHAAAHVIYTKTHYTAKSFDKWQRAVIATIEDARVEALSMRRFPGLKQLWVRQHTATPAHHETAGDYLNRLARALLDECYLDDDPWIVQGRELFNATSDLESDDVSRSIGLTLARAFEKKRIKFKVRTDSPGAFYRDDNRYLWESARLGPDQERELPSYFFRFKLLLTSNEVSSTDKEVKQSLTRDPVQEVSASATYIYPEWDYRSQIETPSWVTLRELTPATGEIKVIDDIIASNSPLISRMKNLLLAIRDKGVRRIRKLEEGDEIDINAAIRAQIDLRMDVQPDTRIMMRSIRKTRDISVLVLLDLSSSANQKVHGQDHTVLQLTQQVCVLFAEAIETVGDPLAIHGFCSKGRHDVEYFRFKDFDQCYDDVPKAKLAGMTGQRFTRMGAAIRHATHQLNQQKSRKKLLMIITDGEPADIDVHDRQYLRYDTKQAVNDAGRGGIHTYCIGLDPKADEYVSRIFGARNYMVVDHIKSLPEKMLLIYAALTL
jgi:uncharacterized protein YegL